MKGAGKEPIASASQGFEKAGGAACAVPKTRSDAPPVVERARLRLCDPARVDLTGCASVEGPGSVIGRYKRLEQIGEGGMGVVYLCETGSSRCDTLRSTCEYRGDLHGVLQVGHREFQRRQHLLPSDLRNLDEFQNFLDKLPRVRWYEKMQSGEAMPREAYMPGVNLAPSQQSGGGLVPRPSRPPFGKASRPWRFGFGSLRRNRCAS